MKVGSLGDIVFTVSPNEIKTMRGFRWRGGVGIETHARHMNTSVQEFTGIEPETVQFSMRLSRHLGTDVAAELEKLRDYMRGGLCLPLVIGERVFGDFRWLICSLEVKAETYDAKGNIVGADVSAELVEY